MRRKVNKKARFEFKIKIRAPLFGIQLAKPTVSINWL